MPTYYQRPSIEPNFTVISGRHVRPLPHPDLVKREWATIIDGYRDALAPLCTTLNEQYRAGLDLVCHANAEAQRRFVPGQGVIWNDSPEDMQAMGYFVGQKSAQFAVEQLAQLVVQFCDNALATLAFDLRPTKALKGAGPGVSGGISVYQLLVAFGNAQRHRHQWRRDPHQKDAKTNIKTLGKFFTGSTAIDVNRAFAALLAENEQGLRILDAIAPGTSDTAPAVSLDALIAMLRDVGNAIIDKLFPDWLKEENERRRKLREAQASAPSPPEVTSPGR